MATASSMAPVSGRLSYAGRLRPQLTGALRLGEGLLVAGLAVEAACQAEPHCQSQPVRFRIGGQGLAGACPASGWRSCALRAKTSPLLVALSVFLQLFPCTAARGLGDGRSLCLTLGVLTELGQRLGAVGAQFQGCSLAAGRAAWDAANLPSRGCGGPMA